MPVAACRWQAGLSHLLIHSGVAAGEGRGAACLWWERMRESAVLYITAKAVSQAQKKNKNNTSDIPPLSRRRDQTLEEREYVEA